MRILGFARRPNGIAAVVQTLRDHGIQVTGPYRTRAGTFIYSLAYSVVTEHELLDLAKARSFDAAGVPELIAKATEDGAD